MKKFLFSEIENFITEKERKLISKTIHNMRNDWRWIGDYPKYSSLGEDLCENQYLLGDAIYCLYDKDFDSVNNVLNDKMKKELSTLYRRLFDKLPKHFGPDIKGMVYYDGLPIPGFHIFNGAGEDEEPFEWHQDTSLANWVDNIHQDMIYSFVCPIELPKTGGTLEWIGSLEKENYINYEYGKLHIWHGLLRHRIGRHTIQEDESRITFQGHVYIDEEKLMHVFF